MKNTRKTKEKFKLLIHTTLLWYLRIKIIFDKYAVLSLDDDVLQINGGFRSNSYLTGYSHFADPYKLIILYNLFTKLKMTLYLQAQTKVL